MKSEGEKLEKMWRVKETVSPIEWFQQIPVMTSKISVQRSAVLGTADTYMYKSD